MMNWLKHPNGFTPTYLSTAEINSLINSTGVDLNHAKFTVVLKRAANAAGTRYQTVEFKFKDRKTWNWLFDYNKKGFELSEYKINGNKITGGAMNTYNHTPENNAKRLFTFAWANHDNKTGFCMGATVSGNDLSLIHI